jgi:di/tricarboxylate transporter
VTDATWTLLVLGAAILAFVTNRVPVAAVAVLTALGLAATGVIDVETALAGFGDPIVLFIAGLFVVSEGIDSTGVTTWAGQKLQQLAGEARGRLMVGLLVLVALLSAAVTPNGATAALIPLAVLLALRTRSAPSHWLMPLAFSASAGALLALTGSPVNVIVDQTSEAAGAGGFSFFEFALIGLPLTVVTIAMSVWLGPRLLPARVAASLPPDLSRYAELVSQHYDLADGFARLRVRSASPLVGRGLDDVDLVDFPGLRLIGVQGRGDGRAPVGRSLEADDVLVVTGATEQMSRAVVDLHLAVGLRRRPGQPAVGLLTREAGAVEVVVPPRSQLAGDTVFPGMLLENDLVVLAVKRLGDDRGPHPTVLKQGDALLVHGSWDSVAALADRRDVLVVDSPDLVRRQAVGMGVKARTSLVVLAGMVALLVAGVPPAFAGLLAATAMVLLGVVGVEQAFRSISWETLVLIGGLIPLSAAMTSSGLADSAASVLVGAAGDDRPLLLLLAVFAFTAALGQLMSNTATVLVVAPIAVSAALSTGISVQPALMIVTVAGAAALLTPIATPANTMVMAPGDYRFGDYWRLGLPIMLVWLVIALLLVPLLWPL